MVKKKLHKLMAGILCASLCFSLAACGAADGSAGESSSLSEELSADDSKWVEDTLAEYGDMLEYQSLARASFDNYDAFINGEWYQENPVTDIERITRLNEYDYTLDERLVDLLENGYGRDYTADEPMYRYHQMYEQFCDSSLEDLSLSRAKKMMDTVTGSKSIHDLVTLMKDENYSLFNPYLSTSYEYSTGETYFVTIDPAFLSDYPVLMSQTEMDRLTVNYTNLLMAYGYEEAEAASMAGNALEMNRRIIEFYLNQYTWSYHSNHPDENTTIPYKSILQKLGYDVNNGKVYYEFGFFATDEYLAFLDQLFVSENLDQLKDLYAVHIAENLSCFSMDTALYQGLVRTGFLGKDFTSPEDVLEAYILSGAGKVALQDDQIPEDIQEEDIQAAADYAFRESILSCLMNQDAGVLTNAYADKYVTDEHVAILDDLTQDLRASLIRIINESTMFTERTKEKLRIKCKKIEIHYGTFTYCNPLEDFELQSNPVDSYLALARSNRTFHQQRVLSTHSELVEGCDTGMFYSNAFYLTNSTCIYVCPGFMAAMENADDMSYEELMGKAGMYMAHELAHAFDSSNIYLDAHCLDTDYLDDAQWNNLYSSYDEIVKGFGSLTTEHGNPVSIGQVFNENYADLLGMKMCLNLLEEKAQSAADIDYDAFFRGFAEFHTENNGELLEKFMLRLDNHMTGSMRINLIPTQFDQFYETYDLSKDSPYYVEEADRLAVFP